MEDLPTRLLASPPYKTTLSGSWGRDGARPLVFSGVARPGIPFLVAALGKALRVSGGGRVWALCGDGRLVDDLESGLPLWGEGAVRMPEMEVAYDLDMLPDPDVMAERLGVVEMLQEGGAGVVVLRETTMDEMVPVAGSLKGGGLVLSRGQALAMGGLIDQLEGAGFERIFQVAERGQFAVRGGIVDLFSLDAELPVRVEFFGDEIESIRSFDIHTQLAEGQVEEARLLLSFSEKKQDLCRVRDYVGEGDVVVAICCPEDTPAGVRVLDGDVEGGVDVGLYGEPLGVFDPGDFVLQDASRVAFKSQVAEWLGDGWKVAMCFHNEGEVERFGELVGEDLVGDGGIEVHLAPLARGFSIPGAKLAVLSDAELFGRYQTPRSRRHLRRESQLRQVRAGVELRELAEGDLVVHAEYGIGKFAGLRPQPGEEHGDEVLWIEYAEEAKLYVPLGQAHLVARYVGAGSKAPKLSRLGGARWSKLKADTEKAIEDYAAKLLAVQAEREANKGYAHPPDGRWQSEFEHSFPYKETPDQLRAIEDTKHDMEDARPMDRLICGDVGFGKTEVAIRAAFKSVMGGRQVAILVPTTVLAQQHYQTFRERMSDYPVNIELLSRFRTPAQQKKVVRGVADGSVDIVIGTHRLIGKDISFNKLGLVVIDEEQRFGVKHKERFKELFLVVDVLTLSATPIPRTLYLSLMGARDMSTIETPPPNRFPVKTSIGPYDERTIKAAIGREVKRGGQVFFLHNRVQTIGRVARRIEELCPGVRTAVGHGQMPEEGLEEVMRQFIAGEVDVLVCTTIIESGIDIPNANTIIIDRADRFGLADLYQLRGRVGRSGVKAHALLLLPADFVSAGDARRRISAIRQYSSLLAGFRIAMRDLEIRGAGNLLGTRQSGHIAAIGFDMYCKLLKDSVARLSGKAPAARQAETSLHVDFLCTGETEYAGGQEGAVVPAFVPTSYMGEPRLRIMAYRSLAELSSLAELEVLVAGWRDRFGRLPGPVENLLTCTRMKLMAAKVGIQSVEIKHRQLRLMRNGKPIQVDGKFPRLVAKEEYGCLEEALGWIAGV